MRGEHVRHDAQIERPYLKQTLKALCTYYESSDASANMIHITYRLEASAAAYAANANISISDQEMISVDIT